MMEFRPVISDPLKTIDRIIYQQGSLGLKQRFGDAEAMGDMVC